MGFPQGLDFFEVLDTAIRLNPLPGNAPVSEQFKRIGLDTPFDSDSLPEATERGH